MNEGYGDFIKKHRILSGYKKQRHFAEKSGISPASMSRIEKGIQKPNLDLLKTMSRYLTSTSYVELMVVCGYWDKDELLEEVNKPGQELARKYINIHAEDDSVKEESVLDSWRPIGEKGEIISRNKKTPTIEEEFLKSVDIDKEDRKQFELKIDGQPLTEEESNGIIAYIRSLRHMKNQNKD